MNNKITPSDCCMEFSIPIYQRLFTWGDAQIERLLEDLKESYDRTTEAPYYLGVLTVFKGKDGKYDLVDGQQRITVVNLLGIAMRGLYPNWDKFLNGGARLHFRGRPEDERYLQYKIAGKDIAAGETNLSMEKGIDCISKWLKRHFDEGRGDDFAEYVYKHLTLFVCELPSIYGDDPASLNRYFEVMNSGGRQLQPHEILLVRMLEGQGTASPRLNAIWKAAANMDDRLIKQGDGQKEADYRQTYLNKIRAKEYDSLKLADKNSQGIDTIPARKISFNNSAPTEGLSPVITFPELLLIVLDISLEREGRERLSGGSFDKTDKLLEIFGSNMPEDIPSFFDNLLHLRLLLDYYVIWREVDKNDGGYDLLMYDKNADIRQFQSMLYVSTSYHLWLLPLLRYLLNTPAPTTESVEREIHRIDRESHSVLPQLEEMDYEHVSLYWFWRLDYELWKADRNDKNVAKYVFRKNRSLEHLHPQDQSRQEDKSWNPNDTDGFGNLAMISAGFNSEQSNDPIDDKMRRIARHHESGQLQSLKLWKMWETWKEHENKWTPKIAQEHGKEMYNILIKAMEIYIL